MKELEERLSTGNDSRRCTGALFSFAMFIFLIAAPVSLANAQPDRETIIRTLSHDLPEYLSISEIEFRNFRGNDEGTGRTSVAGELSLSKDLYVRLPDGLSSRLVDEGWSSREVRYHAKVLGMEKAARQIYGQSHTAGASFPFSAELRYRETVRGFQFFGDPRFPQIKGEPRLRVPNTATVIGTAGFDQMIARFFESRERVAALKVRGQGEIEQAIAGSTLTYLIDDSGVDNRFFVLETRDDVHWTPYERSVDALTFRVQGEGRWLQAGRWANSRFESGESVAMLIEGVMRAEPGVLIGKFDASFTISVPNRSGEGFYNTGDSFHWDGEAFVAKGLLARGKVVPGGADSVSAVRAEGESQATRWIPFSRLPDGFSFQWDTGSSFEFETRGALFDDPDNTDIVTMRMESLDVKDGEIIIGISVANNNPEENYLIFLTTNDDKHYGEKLYLTDNFRKTKFYAKDGLEGSGRIKSFNSRANAYYFKPNSTDTVKIRFPMVTPGADTIHLRSNRVHGHQSAWWIKDIRIPNSETGTPGGWSEEEIEGKREEDDVGRTAAAYIPLIRQKISRNWNRGPDLAKDLEARINVKLTENGEVVSTTIVKSSGSEAFDASVEQAVQRASPLPIPQESRLNREFRNIVLRFRPEAMAAN